MRSLYLLPAVLLCCSCQKSKEETPPFATAEMEAVVMDLELAAGYVLTPGMPNPDSSLESFREIIFKKHGLTEDQYESYLKWYYEHPAALDSVYTHVNRKLEALEIPETKVRNTEPKIQDQGSKTQDPKSRIQSPKSN